MRKKHFIILEIETETDQTPKAAEDMVLEFVRTKKFGYGFTVKSVGWIADNVREAPTGKQDV